MPETTDDSEEAINSGGTRLSRFSGSFEQVAMVKVFIISGECWARF